jgi:hypothetical protein
MTSNMCVFSRELRQSKNADGARHSCFSVLGSRHARLFEAPAFAVMKRRERRGPLNTNSHIDHGRLF